MLRRRSALDAAVEMVSFTCAGWPAGVTDSGLKTQFDSLGKAPQLRLTALANPPAGGTVIVKVADCPAVTMAEAGDAPTAKLGATTVIVTGEDTLLRLFASPA